MTLQPRIRFRPFSHLPGIKCIIPGSWLLLQAFPSRVNIFDFTHKEPIAELPISPPHKPFTVIQDLEKGCVRLGRMEIFAGDTPTSWSFKKSHRQPPQERLHLGNHKKQEWPQAAYRADLRELLPFWYWLSQWTPQQEGGQKLMQGRSLFTEKELTKLFKAGFSDLFVPRLIDESFHGYPLPVVEDPSLHPMLLLQESFPLIRSLFFTESESALSFLLNRPVLFHCGTLAGITTQKGHKISFEWTKHTLRKLQLTAACPDSLTLSFHRELKGCRLDKTSFKNGQSLEVAEGKSYLFDNFS